jgi:hypothetical protein
VAVKRRTGKQVAKAWSQSGGTSEAPSYSDPEKWRAALSEREPQPPPRTPQPVGVRPELGSVGPSRSESAGHGRYYPLTVDDLTAPDADLRLVWADASAWADAHPCDCDALCVCDDVEVSR